MTTLTAHDVALTYRNGVDALRSVSIELHDHELVAVVGPNGAGKSTLIDVLGGVRAPDAGRVEFDGVSLVSLSAKARARSLAHVPQNLDSIPAVSVERFVFAGRYAHVSRWRGATDIDREAVVAALAAADVTHLAARQLSELSGGQRQRVLIARALAQQAPMLLVDEPTAALDPRHQLAVFELLSTLVLERGRGVLVVTHDLNLAAQFAQRIVLMDDGTIVGSGSVDEMLRLEVLEPVYGPRLHVGRVDGVPVVLPWRSLEDSHE